MIINSTLIFCLIPELNSKLAGGRIEKIRQSENAKDIVFSIKKDGKFTHLFYSSDPVNCRVELWTERDFDSIKQNFTDIHLFKRILKAKITGVEQIDFDRVIRITCLKRTELEKEKEYALVFELTGRNTNLISIDKKNNLILDCLKKVGPGKSRYRQITPGLKYILPPPPRKKSPLEIKESEFKKSLSHKTPTDIATFLLESFSGMDKFLARKIIFDSFVSKDKEISELTEGEKARIFRSFQNAFQKIEEHRINPHIIFDQKGNLIAISPFDLSFISKGQKESHRSLNSTMKKFFKLKVEKEMNSQLRQEVFTRTAKGIKSFENLLTKVKDGLGSAEKYQEYRKMGDLLMINKDKIKRGQKTIKVKDIFDPEQTILKIKLNPALSPLQNIKLYYRKYKKAKDSLHIVKKRIAETERKLKNLQKISQGLEAEEFNSEEARKKLASLGFYKKTKKIKKKEKPGGKFSPREFVTSNGWKVLVGRNNKENDHLTFKIARSHDYWFHAQDVGGSHLVLRRENRNQQPPTKTLIEAAKLAAYFSQARSSKKVPVAYTMVKHLRKPKKAKPGLVLVAKEKTIIVTPALPS